MSQALFDPSELSSELNRLTADPKANNNGFLDNFVKMPKDSGAVQVRILPAPEGKKGTQFFCATRTHKLGDRNIHCPRELTIINGQPKWLGKCSICEYYSWLYKQADKGAADASALIAEAKSIKPVERYYYNVIVRDNAETGQGEKNGPLILSIGKLLHTKIIRGIVGDPKLQEEGLGNVMDRATGCDFKIIKIMRPGGEYPDYSQSKFVNPSATGSTEAFEQWLKARHDIFALRKLMSDEELKKALRIFKGAEPDPRETFNPEEIMGPQMKAAPAVVQTVQQVQQVQVAATPEFDELADDDFVKELRAEIE